MFTMHLFHSWRDFLSHWLKQKPLLIGDYHLLLFFYIQFKLFSLRNSIYINFSVSSTISFNAELIKITLYLQVSLPKKFYVFFLKMMFFKTVGIEKSILIKLSSFTLKWRYMIRDMYLSDEPLTLSLKLSFFSLW